MILSDTAIRRPVLAAVINLLLLLAGAAAAFLLPVRQYPNITEPALSITTIYQGADPKTVERSVTDPLEQALNRIPDIRSITSQSSFGNSEVDIQFAGGTNIDVAAQDAADAIAGAMANLPASANLEKPLVEKVRPTAQPIIWLVLRGKNFSLGDLSRTAEAEIRSRLQRLYGVGEITIVGERKPAIRIWLDPGRMAAHGVDARMVADALAQNNVALPSGQIVSNALYFNVNADARLSRPAEIAAITIAEHEGERVHLGDVARVELGAEDYGTLVRFDGQPALGIGIVPQPQANALKVSDAVRTALPELRAALPPGQSLEIGIDITDFIRGSLAEVVKTLLIAFLAVAAVVFLFMHSLRTMLIPMLAIPVSIVGAFAGMWLLGYSINTLTLFALVLAIGLVVDDAIIVLENIYRRREMGEAPLAAARNGAREIAFPVIATTLSLVAIFGPIAMISGDTGRLFREFAVTVAIAVALSGFVALTLTPMLSARMLGLEKRTHGWRRRVGLRVEQWQESAVRLARASLSARRVIGLVLLATLAASVALFLILPTAFAPVEDQGRVVATVSAPAGSNIWNTERTTAQVAALLAANPAVRDYFSATGISLDGPDLPSSGFVYARLKPRAARHLGQTEIVDRLRPGLQALPGALAFAMNPPSLSGDDTDRDINLVVKGPSFTTLDSIDRTLRRRLSQDPALTDILSDLALETPEIDVSYDRALAASLDIPVQAVAESLAIGLGGLRLGTFDLDGRAYPIIAELDPRFRAEPGQIASLAVRTAGGQIVPLSSLTHIHPGFGPAVISHYDLERAFTIGANLADGASLSKAITRVETAARPLLPPGYGMALTGSTRSFAETMRSIYIVFGTSLLFIYLVLAAQFESWVHPIVIMLSVPFALAGSLVMLGVTGNSINLYSGIGIVMLVGLVAKNGILLVDFANQRRARGAGIRDAITQAVGARFRPIVMTSLAMIVGSLPLALAMGPGAESRRPLGWAVVGGLLFSTAFTLLVTPTFYLVVTTLATRLGLSPPPVRLAEDDNTGAPP